MNHYPRHVGDFIGATIGLSLMERGAYSALLDRYYMDEAPLPLDRREVYRMAACTSATERKAVDYVLTRYFSEQVDGWHQKRADEEIEKYRERSDSAKRSINARWDKRNTNVSDSNAERSSNQEPVTSNQEPSAIPVPSTVSLRSTSVEPNPVASPPKTRAAPVDQERQAQARAVWQAYAAAYENRYGVEPTRNAKVSACVVNFLKRVPAEEAPLIAAQYLRNNAAFYVAKGHDFSYLLADAEKLRTEWATGHMVTSTQARQADRTQANGNTFGRLISEAKDGTHG